MAYTNPAWDDVDHTLDSKGPANRVRTGRILVRARSRWRIVVVAPWRNIDGVFRALVTDTVAYRPYHVEGISIQETFSFGEAHRNRIYLAARRMIAILRLVSLKALKKRESFEPADV